MDQISDGLEGIETCKNATHLGSDPLNDGCLFEVDSDISGFEIPETPSPVFSKQNSKPYQATATTQDRNIANDGKKPRSATKSTTHPPKKCLVVTTGTPQKCAKQLFVEGKASSPFLQQKTSVCSKQNESALSSLLGKKSTKSNTASSSTRKGSASKKYHAEKLKVSLKSRDSSFSPVQTNWVNRNCHSSSTVSSSSHSPAMKRAKTSTASSSSSRRASNISLKENECVHSVRTSLSFVKLPMNTSVSPVLKPAESSGSVTLTNGLSDWIDLLDDSTDIVASSEWSTDSPIVIDDDLADNYVRFAQLEEDEAFARHLQAQFDLEAQSPEHRSQFHATRENSFHGFCGLPGCGEYADLLASADIGYCGKPGCREYQHRNDMLASEVIDPVPHDLQRFFVTTGRNRRNRRHSRHQTTSMYINEDINDGNDYEDLLAFEESQGSAVAQKKLSNADINRLPIKFFDPKCAAGKTQCHICFNDYSSGEKLRILPCLHDYHSQCIDRWLKGHISCPICRVDVNLESV
ncbi:uncharacterized protein si:ch211-59o9.10 [Hypanus sabinus]|uniref:uncharacterized protein si:ch211-59o9.10 n=1 Tax=Hypanus sabinus TaxID=79690 RepID=UPI0028C473C1|nr:uncharacterized protein si:ch211-59o9.10 [Hypanus sabinus]